MCEGIFTNCILKSFKQLTMYTKSIFSSMKKKPINHGYMLEVQSQTLINFSETLHQYHASVNSWKHEDNFKGDNFRQHHNTRAPDVRGGMSGCKDEPKGGK